MRWLFLLALLTTAHAAHTPETQALEANIIQQQFAGGFSGQDVLAAQALGASDAQVRFPAEVWELSTHIQAREPEGPLETVKAILAGHALGLDVDRWHAQLVALHDGEQFAPADNLVADMHGIFALATVPGAEAEIAATAQYILHHQNEDGGWPWYPGGESSPDMTGAALAGLHIAGISNEPGFAYLRAAQGPSGALQAFGTDSVQSTAWAAWATQTTGNPLNYDEMAYLAGVVQPDGKLATQHSLWAQLDVLLALELEELPVAGIAPSPGQELNPSKNVAASPDKGSSAGFLVAPALLALAAQTATIKRRRD